MPPVVVWAIVAQRSCGTPRRRLFRSLLPPLLVSAACSAPPPAGAPAREVGADPPLTSRSQPADSPDERSFDVRLDALSGGAPAPGGRTRNPFRFEREAPPPLLPAGAAAGGSPAVPLGAVDGWRPAGEAEAVRFIGVLEAPESVGRVAVLADGGGVHHGRVGDVVVGRYRIVALDRAVLVLGRLEDGERLTLRPTAE